MQRWAAEKRVYSVNGAGIECIDVMPRQQNGCRVVLETGIFAGPLDYEIFSTYIADLGYRVSVLGHRSHDILDANGFSLGKAYADFSACMSAIEAEDDRPLLLVGHSYGAKLGVKYLLRNRFHMDGMRAGIFYGTPRSLAPYARKDRLYRIARNGAVRSLLDSEGGRYVANGIARKFYPNVSIGNGSVRLRHLIEPLGRLDSFLDKLSRDDDVMDDVDRYGPSATPMLFLHGERDTLVDRNDSFSLAEALDAPVIMVPGADHYLEGADLGRMAGIARAAHLFSENPYAYDYELKRCLDGA